MSESFIVYRRSSTPNQTVGLEIQQAAIEGYISRVGGDVLAWYLDVGSAAPSAQRLGKAQPALIRALAHAAAMKATLIVARLDRLTRSTAVLAMTLEDGPPLLVVETPHASPFVLQVYAAVAEEYRRQVSRRVKSGIAAAVAKGRDVGLHAYRSGEGNRRRCRRHAEQLRPLIEDMRRWRPMTTGDVAAELNRLSFVTIRGSRWTPDNVQTLWRWFHRQWSSRTFPGRPSSSGPTATLVARARVEHLRVLIEAYRVAGSATAPAIMMRLNNSGVPTPSGKPWSVPMTRILLRRLR